MDSIPPQLPQIRAEEENKLALGIPTPSGSESAVGLKREVTWGTTPVTGVNPNVVIDTPIFIPIKEESFDINTNIEPQTDDMVADREIQRIVDNGDTVEGGLRLTPGPESIGYLFAGMFGTPTTTTLAASSGTAEGAYQHVWYPALNARTAWPISYSIESKISTLRSKLIRGAVIRKLPIEFPNNAVLTCAPDFLAKDILMLTSASGGTDTTLRTLPAKMTATPVFLDETEFHWKQLSGFVPQLDGVAQPGVTALSYDFSFPGLEGLFVGGSGRDIGTFRVDNFQLGGKVTMLLEDETMWNKIYNGAYFKLESQLTGDLIQGAFKNKLTIVAYSCKAPKPGLINKVGNLEYSFDWTARQDPTAGKSCLITLINTVASYA